MTDFIARISVAVNSISDIRLILRIDRRFDNKIFLMNLEKKAPIFNGADFTREQILDLKNYLEEILEWRGK